MGGGKQVRKRIEFEVTAKTVLPVITMLILYALATYRFHVPLNFHVISFYVWLTGTLLVAVVAVAALSKRRPHDTFVDSLLEVPHGRVAFAPLAVMLLLLVVSSPLFAAATYASLLDVRDSEFAEWDDKLLIEGISLMDTASATRVGSRELGSLQDVVSQFDDGGYYQVIVGGSPQKVSPLKYVGFFSWLNNRRTGTPGYVSVDPIKQDADYHELESIEGTGDGMRFVPSAWFNENLQRHLWLHYPTEAFGKTHFELDDEGHPYYVTQVMGFKTLMGAEYVEGVVVTDPTDGSTAKYDAGDVPEWLDVVYDGDLLDQMYDWHGSYSGGYLNSVFGQVGCTRTGGDYGYVMIDGEQWIYTGVTSMGSDASNIGFLLASERTGETYFLPMASADEESAMSSAEGKVQQYGYDASFPSLVSIDRQPTYVMVLKDDAGLIRLYAMVNAESYNVVACESDLVSCKEEYEKAMRVAGIEFADDEQEMPEVDATGATGASSAADAGGDSPSTADPAGKGEAFSAKVVEMQLADEGGDTYLYVLADGGDVYRIHFSDDPKACMSMKTGDALEGKAVDAGEFLEVTEIGAGKADGSTE